MILILYSSKKFLQKNFISHKKYYWKSSGSSLKNIILIDSANDSRKEKEKNARRCIYYARQYPNGKLVLIVTLEGEENA